MANGREKERKREGEKERFMKRNDRKREHMTSERKRDIFGSKKNKVKEREREHSMY